jgi:hypothetical protein
VLWTEGYNIEVRKYCDVAGRGRRLINDVVNRTITAMPQAHAFLVSQLALKAEAQAIRLGHLRG